jgi:hypothetical protein
MRCQSLILENTIYVLIFIFVITSVYGIYLNIQNAYTQTINNYDRIKHFYTLEKVEDAVLKNATHVLIKLEYPLESKLPSVHSKIVYDNETLVIYTR